MKMKEKLVVQIGKDKHDNPIYKEVKKLHIQFFDENKILHTAKSRPFWTSRLWMLGVLDKLFVIEKSNIFFNKRKQFWIIVQSCKTNQYPV